ncbi:ribosylnicotinamide kinase [Ascosphaera atra]|nr:ribosylnicotinamide kinase [Ascosphaera atra]
MASQYTTAPTTISSNERTLLIGIGGPSSSGKTTLARLLLTIFNDVEAGPLKRKLRSFIVHEDDFYKPDDQIPVAKLPSGKEVADWDTIEAIDVPKMKDALSHVCQHGRLPGSYHSKEDKNKQTDSGVTSEEIDSLRSNVISRLQKAIGDKNLTMPIIEGFILYGPSDDQSHPLHDIRRTIHVPLFLPVTYSLMKERRESRGGYVTTGPSEQQGDDGSSDHSNHFWVDPPGYVDDIVWPRYIREHAWLLAPDAPPDISDDELKKVIGEGTYIRDDSGLLVAPGMGASGIPQLLEWAVEEILETIEKSA